MAQPSELASELVGQEPAVEVLTKAVAAANQLLAGEGGTGMTHAWLFTGPPGSGRSNAAKAFAAQLQGSPTSEHPDITVIATDRLSIDVAEVRELVRKSALRPAMGRWQIIIIEDADRLTEKAADALLKSLEEPSERTLWLLCAPTPEDVIVTVRSRTRHVLLRTPPQAAIAKLLQRRNGVDEETAIFAAQASQGHIGRAVALATKPDFRERRFNILSMPIKLRSLADALQLAGELEAAAKEHAEQVAAELDAKELTGLRESWGVEERGRRPAGFAGQLSEMETGHKRRRTRLVRDSIDGALIELLSMYRDVLTQQVAPGTQLVNSDFVNDIQRIANETTANSTLKKLTAIGECREALSANAAALLALETLMVKLIW